MNLAALNAAWARSPHLIAQGLRHLRRNGTIPTLRRTLEVLGFHGLASLLGYGFWTWFYWRCGAGDRRKIKAHIARLTHRPLISVVMPVYDTPPAFLCGAIDSVLRQLYPHWELCIADDASGNPEVARILAGYAAGDRRVKLLRRPENGGIAAATNSALSLVEGDFVAFLDHDDELSELALYMVAVEIDHHPDAGLIYSDEDKIDEEGRYCRPYFKPDWNRELFYGQNYVNHLSVIRRSAVGGCRAGFDGSQDYDLLLRVIETLRPEQIRHIPMVLYHWRHVPSSFSETAQSTAGLAARRAVAEHLARGGVAATVSPAPDAPQYRRLHYPLPEPAPRVSVVIPTRDRSDLLRQCVDGLLYETDYPDIEIIIVDNGSVEAGTFAYFDEVRKAGMRVLRYDAPFNYSAINNFAVGHASGTLVCLLNNDIKIIHRDWLREMASHAVRAAVGAVGAKLYFPDDTIQHAGVVTGLGGGAGHLHISLPRESHGYFDDLNLAREVSCVTGACLLMRRGVFDEVGGLDETGLPIAFNDVDLCLKIRAKGYLVLWTPFAALYHFESASRGSDLTPDKIGRFRREMRVLRERWEGILETDPYYSPNRSLNGCQGDLAFPPRPVKPWKL